VSGVNGGGGSAGALAGRAEGGIGGGERERESEWGAGVRISRG
jgi:hypothetical protein